MNIEPFDYNLAFSRNIGLLTVMEQELLRVKKVAIPGCGGVGGIHAQTLARAGVGSFVIADFDRYDIENMNRQWGAKMSTLGERKVDVIAREIKEINPEATIEIFDKGISSENIDEFLSGVDAVADSLDFFAFEARELLFTTAYRKSIPVVTGAPAGFSCALLVFTGDGMSFEDYFNFKKSDSRRMKAIKLLVALAPKATQKTYLNTKNVDIDSGKGPSISIGVTQCASLVCGHVLKIMLGRGEVKSAPHYAQFDVYRNMYKKGYLPFGNRNLLQRLKIWYVDKIYLKKSQPKRIDDAKVTTTSMMKFSSNVLKLEELREIVRLMMRSPTGDNCQHWKFVFNNDSLKIYHDEDRARHEFNQNNHASKIALGALLESARIASSHYGLRIEETITLDEKNHHDDTKHWAEIKFIKDDIKTDKMFSMLDLRSTDRRPYKGGTTEHWVFDKVREVAQGLEKAGLHFCNDFHKPLLEYFAKSDTFVWKTEPARVDLHAWLRFSKKEIVTTRDGVPWQTLGATWFQSRILKLSRTPWIQSLLNRSGFLTMTKSVSIKCIKTSATLGLISAKEKSTESLYDVGRLLLKIWLRFNSANYSFHMLSSSSLIAYDLECGHFSKHASSEFEEHYKQGRSLLNEWFNCNDEEIPVIAFRVGLNAPLSENATTLRLSVDEVLEVK